MIKIDTKNRTENFVLTLKSGPGGDGLFKFISKTYRGISKGRHGHLERYGRNPHRKENGLSRSTIPIGKSTRFDVYVAGDNTFDGKTPDRINTLLKMVRWTLIHNAELVLGVDRKYEDLFRDIPIGYTKPVSAPKTNPMKKTTKQTKWNVTLKATITVDGDSYRDLEQTVRVLPLSDTQITAHERLDTHLDLPLVQFSYPSSDWPHTDKIRSVRVVEKNDENVEGFENDQYKVFKINRIGGDITLIEIPKKA